MRRLETPHTLSPRVALPPKPIAVSHYESAAHRPGSGRAVGPKVSMTGGSLSALGVRGLRWPKSKHARAVQGRYVLRQGGEAPGDCENSSSPAPTQVD